MVNPSFCTFTSQPFVIIQIIQLNDALPVLHITKTKGNKRSPVCFLKPELVQSVLKLSKKTNLWSHTKWFLYIFKKSAQRWFSLPEESSPEMFQLLCVGQESLVRKKKKKRRQCVVIRGLQWKSKKWHIWIDGTFKSVLVRSTNVDKRQGLRRGNLLTKTGYKTNDGIWII